MKIKRQPEDFVVEELTGFQPSRGPFALYALTKRSIGTPEALEAVARRWNLPRESISFGGLKDRHAQTTQWITIRGGLRRGLKQANLELKYVGQAPRPFGPKDIEGNRFRIVLRDFSRDGEKAAKEALSELSQAPLPNYFDDQRFGSLGASGEFVGRAWCEQRYERAVWLALAEENEHDRPEDRSEKKILRDEWGNWAACKAKLSRSHRRSLVTFLADRPGDFKGAMARINADLRGLYLSSFQSFLWNRVLSRMIQDSCPDAFPVDLKSGRVLFFRSLSRPLDTIPLPSARARFESDAMRARVEASLKEIGLELKALKIRHPRENFFSRGERAATFRPAGLDSEWGADDLYPGNTKLALRFDLPRGSYATILVKRISNA
ncbi:MAG TPA: tRNA pseudouridine(13) synthase TruD [Planctomycetota bacterium]|nr:tRNA pseudouridine(13) synthase TruD [Planctomycetota bacterium]